MAELENNVNALKRRPTADTPAIKADRLREARRAYERRLTRKATKEERATAERQRLLRSWYACPPQSTPSRLSTILDPDSAPYPGAPPLH